MKEKNNKQEMVYLPVKDLKLNPNNPRKNDDSVPKVMLSIQKYGFKNPLVCNSDLVVYCGNTRLKAARKLKLKEVPCIVADDLSPEEIREFAIVDNKSNEIAEWDDDILKAELEELEGLNEFGFDFGLTESEEEPETETVEDEPPEVDERHKPITKQGDVWLLGSHRLMCGDSTKKDDVLTLTGGANIDLVITDPPYNVNYEGKTKDHLKIGNDKQEDSEFLQFLQDAFSNFKEILKPGGAFYIWHADSEGFNFRYACKLNDLTVRECLIWNKNAMVMGRQDYQWKHEPCLYGWKDGAAHYFIKDRTQTTILNFNKPTKSEMHPTMKPVALFSYQIKNSSRKGENVADLFGGSGTTIIACEQLGRTAFSMEYDPKYCDVIVKRYINFTGSSEGVFLLRNGNKIPYSEVSCK